MEPLLQVVPEGPDEDVHQNHDPVPDVVEVAEVVTEDQDQGCLPVSHTRPVC